jgi:hypothetical protein
LNGTVTLQPRPPAAAKARTAASKPSIGHSDAAVVDGLPGLARELGVDEGDWLCATGWPSTA